MARARWIFCLGVALLHALCAFGDDNSNIDNQLSIPPVACTNIEPPPQNETCGSVGSLSSPALSADPQQVGSIDLCRDLCARHGQYMPRPGEYRQQHGCYLFGYEASTQACNLYFKGLGGMGFVSNASSGIVFNSMRCFNCSSKCGAGSTSLLDNGGFEFNAELDGPWIATGGSLTTPGYKSIRAFSCNGTSCSLSQLVQTCANSSYHLSFAYKVASKVKLDIYGGNLEGYDALPATGADWGTAQYWFKTPGAGVTEVGLPFSQADNLQVDSAVLTRLSAPFQPAPGAPELVVNGGFENGQFAPFTFQRGGRVYNYSIVSPGLDGSKYAVKLVGFVTDDSDSSSINQVIRGLVPGTSYLVRFTAVNQGGAYYPTVYIGGLFFSPPFFSRTKRYDFSIPFQARRKAVLLSLMYDYGPLLIDNISVKKLG